MFENFKKIQPKELKKILSKAMEITTKNRVEIATEMGITSLEHIRNCVTDPEKVSDSTLTKFMNAVGVDGAVVTYKGEKIFLINNN